MNDDLQNSGLTPHEKELQRQKNEQIDSSIDAGLANIENHNATLQMNQQQAEVERAELQENLNEDGTPKSTHETMEPSEYGLTENLQEAKNALVSGTQDIWNNTVGLGKVFDPKFWFEKSSGQDPYEFASDWKFNDQPLTKTAWGNVVKQLPDIAFGALAVGRFTKFGSISKAGAAGKAGSLTKLQSKFNKLIPFGPLAGVNVGNLATQLGRGAVTGAAVAAWDEDSHGDNLAKALLDVAPQWASPLIEPFASKKDMTPAQRTLLNILEEIGIGAMFDVAATGIRSRRAGQQLAEAGDKVKDAAKKKGIEDPPNMSKVQEQLDVAANKSYEAKTADLYGKTEAKYNANQFKSLKRNGIIPEDVTIDEWKDTWKTPKPDEIKAYAMEMFGDTSQASIDKVSRKIRPRWRDLSEGDKDLLIQQRAANDLVDYGPDRDFTRFSVKQGKQATEIGVDQLSRDLVIGQPRINSFYELGSETFENQPLSGTSVPSKGVLDQIQIRGDWTAKRGSNRAPFTEASVRRMAATGKANFDEIDELAKKMVDNDDLKALYAGPAKKDLQNDFVDAAIDLKEFLGDAPNSRMMSMTEEDMLQFLFAQTDDAVKLADNLPDRIKQTADVIDGVSVLNHRQTVMADVWLGQMTQQIRDIAKASLSVSNAIDTAVDGGMIDAMMSRYKALARWRGRTSAAVSQRLRNFGTPTVSGRKVEKSVIDAAEQSAADAADTLIKVLKQDDEKGHLFEAFQYFAAASNGKPMTFKDMESFFSKRLKGYAKGNEYHKNVVLSELAAVGINSMLSGPKTFARAGIGSGLNTFMRPAASYIGANMIGDAKTARGSLAALGAMMDSIGDATRKAVADFNTYLDNGGNFRGSKANKAEQDFKALEAFYQAQGTDGEKLMMSMASTIRGLNKNPFLTYGPRIMHSMDTFFGQLIGRARQRELAFNQVYDQMEAMSGSVSSLDMKTAVREAELKFDRDLWTSDGQLKDEMANFTWDEAALKGELPPWAQKIEQATNMMPFVKPFVGLFMKTGVNALELTAKHTPIMNRILQEVRDIATLQAGDPALLRYGIQTADDLAKAKAVQRGREAIGAGFIATAGMLYLDGSLTGNGPPDAKLRNAWIQSGAWQPRSIKIGDTFISYEALEPFNTFLSFVADVGDGQKVMGERWAEDHMRKFMYLISSNITNKTFLAGLMNVQDLITGKGQRSEAIMANLVNNQIPLSSLRNEIGKLVSPGMRELNGDFVESIRNRNLWYELMVDEKGRLPYRYDILDGSPLRDWEPMTRSLNGMLPFNVNSTTSQTRELLYRSRINLHQTFNTGPDGENLTDYPELRSRFQYLLSQQGIENKLTQLFKNPKMMESILDMERETAKGEVFEVRTTFHSTQIETVFKDAKKKAWLQLKEEDSRAVTLGTEQELRRLADKARKAGRTDKAREIQDLLANPR